MAVRLFDDTIGKFLVLFGVSFIAAIVFFYIGGSLAEIAGEQDSILGFSFKAGGALAGFILIFWISLKAMERLHRIRTERHQHQGGQPQRGDRDLAIHRQIQGLKYELLGKPFDKQIDVTLKWMAGRQIRGDDLDTVIRLLQDEYNSSLNEPERTTPSLSQTKDLNGNVDLLMRIFRNRR